MQGNRLTFLDSMRGFAAAWVVLFHFNEIGQFVPTAYQWFVKHGWLGVPIFFVISGYSIHASLLRSPSPGKFLWRRFWRIYPPYLASLAVVMVVIVARKLETGTNDLIAIPNGWIGWLEIFTLTTKPVTSTDPINWVYWTLSYEAVFYLWLTLALIAPRLRWPILFTPIALSLFWHEAPIFFIDQWCLFALGAAIAEWRHAKSVLVPILVLACLVDSSIHQTKGEVVSGIVAVILVAMACTQRFSWLNCEPIFQRLGEWSYSLYLTHVPIGVWVALRVDPYPRARSASSFPLHISIDAFAFVACVVFAYWFWRLVELPSIRIAHRKPLFRQVGAALRCWRARQRLAERAPASQGTSSLQTPDANDPG